MYKYKMKKQNNMDNESQWKKFRSNKNDVSKQKKNKGFSNIENLTQSKNYKKNSFKPNKFVYLTKKSWKQIKLKKKMGLIKKKRPKRLPTEQVQLLNKKCRLKFWLNRPTYKSGEIPLDLYISIRRTLIRRQTLVTSYSPYFLNFLKWKPLKTASSSALPRLENLKNFKFFGYRLSLYTMFKKRWESKPYSYKHRYRILLNSSKPDLISSLGVTKKSPIVKSYLKEFLESKKLSQQIKTRAKTFSNLLRKENLLKSIYLAFDFNKFWKSNVKLSHPIAVCLFDYFMNLNGSRFVYNIFRQPLLYRLRREHKKYKFFNFRIKVNAYRKLAEQLRLVLPTVVVQPSLNNLIVYVYKRKQLIFSLSAGMTLRNKGDSRQTNAAKFNLLDYACTKLEQLGIKTVDLKILDNSKRRTFKFYKSFLYKRKFKVRQIICAKCIAHNGIRPRKSRRI